MISYTICDMSLQYAVGREFVMRNGNEVFASGTAPRAVVTPGS